jgi:prepilin-type N-terminal cleavage/methylation domain-containing protein
VSRGPRRQAGYTLVETIVAITVGAIVMAAIFPIFLLLYRVETTWGNAAQARASGLLAEESLLRDLRAYCVDQIDPVVLADRIDSLVLSGLASNGQTYHIEYYVDRSKAPLIAPTLIRLVTKGGNTISKALVAHGIEQLTARHADDRRSIQLEILTSAIGGPAVHLDPVLVVTPRNPPVCP